MQTDREGGRQVVFAATDGRVAGAWRGPDPGGSTVCQVGPTAVGDHAAAFGIRVGYGGLPRQWRLHHASLDSIGASVTATAILEEDVLVGTSAVQHVAVSRTTVAAELQPQSQVLVFEEGAMRALGGVSSATPGIPQRVQVVGRVVWWEDWGHPTSIVLGSMTREATYFHRIVPDDALAMQVDTQWLSWSQGYGWDGSSYASVELWAAAYAEDASGFAPRRVRDLDVRGVARAGAGVYGFRRTDGGRQRVELYDLADGRRRTFFAPDGGSITDSPLYITANEMLVMGGMPVAGGRGIRTVFRVQLSSLAYE